MSFDAVLAGLRGIDQANAGKSYRDRSHLTEDDIKKWCALMGKPRAALFDQIATWLARGFHNSELTFGFCDFVVNEIFAIITSGRDSAPRLFWEVYLAFDEGEYYHGDNRDEDPVAIYTRPAIAQIVAKLP